MSDADPDHRGRRTLKSVLGRGDTLLDRREPRGATLLIYHRIGDGTPDELDVARSDFARQVERLQDARVVSIDEAADHVEAGNGDHRVVITFDDGFDSLYHVAWPLLRAAGLPFTVYLASGYVDREMRWPGSTAVGPPGHGLGWDQLREMLASGLLTVANHTHDHVRPERLTAEQLDRCTEAVEHELGVTTTHFAYTWGVAVESAAELLAARFRTASTGTPGRNTHETAPMRWRRLPVRGSDPPAFFAAQLSGGLVAQSVYERLVTTSKHAARALGGA